MGPCDRLGRVRGVMQGLAQEDKVHRLPFDGWVLQVTQTEFEVLQAVFLRLCRAESDDFFRIVDRNHFAAALRQ